MPQQATAREGGVSCPSSLNLQGLCNISWSVAVLDLQGSMRLSCRCV